MENSDRHSCIMRYSNTYFTTRCGLVDMIVVVSKMGGRNRSISIESPLTRHAGCAHEVRKCQYSKMESHLVFDIKYIFRQ